MRPSNSSQTGDQNAERGNVFLFILLGVVLFAALAFVISRGFRSDTTTAMSARQAELAAVDILTYSQRLSRAVSKLQQRGTSENDISFEHAANTGYGHTPAEPDTHAVFHPDGGGLSWQTPPASVNDGSPWHFTGSTCIPDIGNGAAGCGADGDSNEELLAVLPNVNASVCAAIDAKLNIGAVPSNSGGAYSNTKFTGAYADATEIDLGASYNAACYEDGGDYYFYTVLIAR